MKALYLRQKNQPPVVETRARASLRTGYARVKVLAAALNRRDVWIMRGQYPGIKYPVIPGSDGCGVVQSIDAHAEEWLGRRVVFYPAFEWGDRVDVQSSDFRILGMPDDGTFAEFIDVPIANLRAAPEHLTDGEAAALPLAGLTAWRAVMTRGRLRAGENVFITGIGGGVALMAAQLALACGATVVVSSHSPAKLTQAAELGIHGGVNYQDTDWAQHAKTKSGGGFDLIVDGAGGPGFGDLLRVLNPAARLVYYGGTRGKWPEILPQRLFYRQVDLLASTMGSPDEMDALLEFVTTHKIRPVVAKRFGLDAGADAFAYLEANQQFGKVVLDVSTASST